jgi:hypothetical protein
MTMRNKEISSFKAALVSNVRLSTCILERYVKNVKEFPFEVTQARIGGKTVLPPPTETDLAEFCLTVEERFIDHSQKYVRYVAYQLAVSSTITYPISRQCE